MSKDIWHIADVKPKSLKTFVYKTDKGHIGTSMLVIDSGWTPVLLPEFYSMDDFDKAERITKWCYLDDLLAAESDLEHTRKALDVAVGQLKKTHDYIEDFRYQETNYFLVDSKDVSIILDETNEALEQITALEQKEE